METERGADVNEPFLRDSARDDEFNVDDSDSPSNESIQNRWHRKPSVFWLLPVFLLSNLAMALVMVPKTNLFVSLVCRQVMGDGSVQHVMGATSASHNTSVAEPNHREKRHMGMGSSSIDYNEYCQVPEVESGAAMLALWANLITGVLAALITPLAGKISDGFGRIKIMAGCCIGILAAEFVVVLVAVMPDTFSVKWLYFSFLIEGLSGSFILQMGLATSYAADCTAQSEQNVAFGWFHGSMFLGMAIGPALGGWVSGAAGSPIPVFYISCGLRVLAIVLLAFVPESLSETLRLHDKVASSPSGHPMSRRSAGAKSLLKDLHPRQVLDVLLPSSKIAERPLRVNLICLASINTLIFGCALGSMSVLMLYPQYIFKWENMTSGLFISTINIFRAIATIIFLPFLVRWVRKHNSWPFSGSGDANLILIRIAIISDVIGYLGYTIAPNGTLFTFSGTIAALGSIWLASTEAFLTKQIDARRVGELMGALGLLQSLSRVVAPTVINLVYAWSVKAFSSLVFLGIAGLFIVMGGISVYISPADSTKS